MLTLVRFLIGLVWLTGPVANADDGPDRPSWRAAPVLMQARPIVANIDYRIGHGAIGSAVFEPGVPAQEEAGLVLQIFNGEQAGQIPIAESAATGLEFDWRLLQRWAIAEDKLPDVSEIRFRDLGLWQRYPAFVAVIAAAPLTQTGLIISLLYAHRCRSRAEVPRNIMAESTQFNCMATAGELSTSIAHEVKQPLTGIVRRANGRCGGCRQKRRILREPRPP